MAFPISLNPVMNLRPMRRRSRPPEADEIGFLGLDRESRARRILDDVMEAVEMLEAYGVRMDIRLDGRRPRAFERDEFGAGEVGDGSGSIFDIFRRRGTTRSEQIDYWWDRFTRLIFKYQRVAGANRLKFKLDPQSTLVLQRAWANLGDD